jgi:hypothetical protein
MVSVPWWDDQHLQLAALALLQGQRCCSSCCLDAASGAVVSTTGESSRDSGLLCARPQGQAQQRRASSTRVANRRIIGGLRFDQPAGAGGEGRSEVHVRRLLDLRLVLHREFGGLVAEHHRGQVDRNWRM